MAQNLGTALSGMKTPGKARKGNASIGAIDPMPAKPKTFTDKNLDGPQAPGNPAIKVVKPTAKPGGSISPQLKVSPRTAPAPLVKA